MNVRRPGREAVQLGIRRWSKGFRGMCPEAEARLEAFALRRVAPWLEETGAASASETLRAPARSTAAALRRLGLDAEELVERWLDLGDAIVDALVEGRDSSSGKGTAAAADTVGAAAPIHVVHRAVSALVEATHALDRGWAMRTRDERSQVLRDQGRVLVHEMKNRLGAAETAVMMLAVGDGVSSSEEKRHRLLDLTRRALAAAHATAEEIRVLSALRDPARLPRVRSEPARDLVRRVFHQLEDDARAKGVTLHLEARGGSELPVPAAPVRVALHTLVANGIHHSDPSEAESWVRVGVALDNDGCVRFVIRDNGVGIGEADLVRVFGGDAYVEGRGLGLAVAREAVERAGGTVVLSSRRHEGTTVEMGFPRVETPS